ncbi:MAG: hypothetical protein WDM78_14675 [Puia sp.]
MRTAVFGILLGQKDILQSAWQASSPHHGPGRDNKVGREEMIGAIGGHRSMGYHGS